MKLEAVISVILVTLIGNVRSRDSCENWGEYLCGDLCINQHASCYCGDKVLQGFLGDRENYCCIPPSEDRQVCYQDQDGAGHCRVGRKLLTGAPSEECHGRCFNEYQNYNRTRLGERARYRCDDGQCASVGRMCRDGYAACLDRSDLKECTETVQCSHTTSSHSQPSLGPRYAHTECQYERDENNGEYDNIGRGDERSLTALVLSSPVNYTELQPCTTAEGQPGLTCGEKCKEKIAWCRGGVRQSDTCTTATTQFSTSDATLCSNTTFWAAVSCNVMESDGEIQAFGRRCSAASQHCYYPWYSKNTEDFRHIESHMLPTCHDYSDRIFHINTSCNITAYVEEYCAKVCSGTNRLKHCKEEICQNKTVWISNQTDRFILDPHNCQSSCQDPSRGCDACTNTEEYFNCSESGVCIHRDLLCDGHRHCEHGEDEDYEKCLPTYIKHGVIREYGTQKCPNRMYPKIFTLAVVCDGVPECEGDTDEPAICDDKFMKFYTWGALVAIIVLWLSFQKFAMKFRTTSASGEAPERFWEKMKMEKVTDESSYRNFHQSELFSEEMNIVLAELKYSENSDDIKKVCDEILKLEQICHRSNENELFCCLHQHLEPELFGMIMEIYRPGYLSKRLPAVATTMARLRGNENVRTALNRSGLISSIMEISKDFILAGTMLAMIGGPQALTSMTFTSTTVLCLLMTIFIPLIFSTLGLAMEDPEVILKPYKISKKLNRVAAQALVIIFSIFNPILLLNSQNENERKLRKESGEKLLARLQEGARIKKQYVKYLKTELGLETFYQLPLQLILLFAARTLTKTNGGLEAVFGQSEFLGLSADTFLIISTLVSFKTCVLLHWKQIKTDKEYLPGLSQVFVLLWGLFASVKRVMAIVAVFIPSLGLFNVLHHWQAEQIPFSIRKEIAEGLYGINASLTLNDDTLELNGLPENTVYWRDLDRTDWSDPQHPVFAHYTLYTGLTLGQTFQAFLVLFCFHLMAIIAVKIFTADILKKAGKFELLRHCLENMNIPVPYEDFDVGGGEITDYRERRRKVNREMFFLMMVNLAVSILMITPLIYIGQHL